MSRTVRSQRSRCHGHLGVREVGKEPMLKPCAPRNLVLMWRMRAQVSEDNDRNALALRPEHWAEHGRRVFHRAQHSGPHGCEVGEAAWEVAVFDTTSPHFKRGIIDLPIVFPERAGDDTYVLWQRGGKMLGEVVTVACQPLG